MAKQPKNIARKVIDPRDDSVSWELDITYDITEEGISFGTKRNYNPSFIKKLIESKYTRDAVDGGYSMVMYGHMAREEQYDMFAQEHHPHSKEIQVPLGRVTHISIHSKWVNIKMVLPEAKHNMTETIVQLIKHGIGGFSTFFSTMDKGKSGILKGVDYVLARNFKRNQIDEVLMDSIGHVCSGGSCQMDVKVKDIAEELVGEHVELIPQTVELLNRNPVINESKEVLREVHELTAELAETKMQLEAFKKDLDSKNRTIKMLLAEKGELQKEVSNFKPVVREVVKEVEKVVEVRDLENEKLLNDLTNLLREKGIEPIVVNQDSQTVTDTEIEFNEGGDSHLPSITDLKVKGDVLSNIYKDTFIDTGMKERELNVGALQDAFMKTQTRNKASKPSRTITIM
jgi:hypothetical protein